MAVFIHPRVHDRHPEITDDDARAAWKQAIRSAPRSDTPNMWVTVGTDWRGRLIELVARSNAEGDWLVFHAMTPPSSKTLTELGLRRSRR